MPPEAIIKTGNYNQRMETIIHEIPPVFDAQSRILILGTMPSPKSREAGFYYGHPQNRFWKALAAALRTPVPAPGERRAYLLWHHIAMWDVLSRCDIIGAADSSIKNPKANDFSAIFAHAGIKKVFCTGITAARLYRRAAVIPVQNTFLMPACANMAEKSLAFGFFIDESAAPMISQRESTSHMAIWCQSRYALLSPGAGTGVRSAAASAFQKRF